MAANRFYSSLPLRGLSKKNWRALCTLSSRQEIPLGEFAKIVTMEQSTATQLVDRLVAKGLVKKRAATDDRRKVLVSITDEGYEIVAPMLEEALRIDNSIADSFDLEEARELKKTLKKLINKLG